MKAMPENEEVIKTRKSRKDLKNQWVSLEIKEKINGKTAKNEENQRMQTIEYLNKMTETEQ